MRPWVCQAHSSNSSNWLCGSARKGRAGMVWCLFLLEIIESSPGTGQDEPDVPALRA